MAPEQLSASSHSVKQWQEGAREAGVSAEA